LKTKYIYYCPILIPKKGEEKIKIRGKQKNKGSLNSSGHGSAKSHDRSKYTKLESIQPNTKNSK
jgi:hypothetical protein